MTIANEHTYDSINQASIAAGEDYLARPRQRMRPDRREIMNPVGSGLQQALGDGLNVEWLVGQHNRARNLATGIVQLSPGVCQAHQRHHVEEAITALDGRIQVDVENRSYELMPLDSLLIPSGLVHRVKNLDGNLPAQCHVAFPIAEVTASPATPPSTESSTRLGRQERLIRHASAERHHPSPNVTFIYFYSRDLTPGVRMCGGFGLFLPDGRLPAHLHDCDESICIVQGVATCWVEGRRYPLSDYATALQPRGRVHYFINDSPQPMAMLWVYAAPTPARVVVDERCAVEKGFAWPH